MSKWHKANQPNQPGVQKIGTDSSLITTYSFRSVVYLLRESDEFERINFKKHLEFHRECIKRTIYISCMKFRYDRY